LGPSGF